MNYRYRVDDIDIILSPEEHEVVKLDFNKGLSPVFLRGGKLALNKNFVRYVVETENLTLEQEEKRNNVLKLPIESESAVDDKKEEARSYLERTHDEFYKRMGWDK